MIRGVMLAAVALGVAGCVAPEPEPVRVLPRSAAAQAPLPANLEPAPLANRGMRSPGSSTLINLDAGPLTRKPGAADPTAAPAR